VGATEENESSYSIPAIEELDVPSLLRNAEEQIVSAELLESVSGRNAASMLCMAAESVSLALCNRAGVTGDIPYDPGELAKLLPAGHPMGEELASFGELLSESEGWRYPDPDGGIRIAPGHEELAARAVRIRSFLANAIDHVGPASTPSV
jgi:hypothetical protein